MPAFFGTVLILQGKQVQSSAMPPKFRAGEQLSPLPIRGRRVTISEAIADLVAREFQENGAAGYQLVKFCAAVVRGEIQDSVVIPDKAHGPVVVPVPPSIKDRLRAAEMMLDRLAGKPRETLQVEKHDNGVERISEAQLEALSDDDLRQLLSILDRGARAAIAAGPGNTGKAQPHALTDIQSTRSDAPAGDIPGPSSDRQ